MVSRLGEAAFVFLVSAGFCLAVGQWAIRYLGKLQAIQPVRYEDCPPLQAYQHAKRSTPSMGGLFVLPIALTVAIASGGLRDASGWLLLWATVGMGLLGLCDDMMKFRGPNARGVRTLPKLVVALAIGGLLGYAMVVGAEGVTPLKLPWREAAVDLGWAWVPCSMVVFAGTAHAVNLTDGMDGLAVGCLAIALAVFGVAAMSRGPFSLVPWCASFAGACVGFLWFNSFPATVFLGDVGALALGGALGAIALLTHAALWLAVVGGIFVAEALSVMLQVASYKWRHRRRLFRVAPLHHHFHLGGVTEPKLIVRFWIVGLLLAMAGLTAMEHAWP